MLENIKTYITTNLNRILMTVLILTYVFFAYSYFTRSTYVEPLVKPVATVIDSIPTESTQQTTIGYVERAPNDNAQVALDTNLPQVVVRANDKEYTMPSTVKESSAFENGQLKIKQESTTKIDVTQVVNEQMEQERKLLKAKSQREKVQHTFWGVVGGATAYAIFHR